MRSPNALFLLFALPLASVRGQPVPAPSGWTATRAGASWTYAPSSLPTGQLFTLTLEPAQKLSSPDLGAWLTSQAKADVAKRGTLIGTIAPQQNSSGAWVAQTNYRDAQGQSWIALYTAAAHAGDSVQFSAIVTNLPVASAIEYARTAGTIVGGANVRSTTGFMVMHEGRGQTTAGGYAYVESADLLLSDGWAYLGLTVPPELLDESASKQREPAKWRRWKQSGSDVLIQDASGQWTKLAADRARPLPAGAAMGISLIHRNSTRFGGMGSYNTSATIAFSQNGRFARSSGVIAGTGAVQAGGGFGGSASSYQDQHGSGSASAGGNGQVTTTTTSRVRGNANLGGTYKVTGYTLELDGDGGAVQRVLAFYPFTDNESVYIDGVTYGRVNSR